MTRCTRRAHRGCAGAAALRGAAAARALHPHSVVRAQVPLLRFQFARGARRRAGGRYVDALLDRSRVRAAVDLGAPDRLDLHRRRHAEPVLARRRSTACLSGVRARVPLIPDAEITLEANPGTFERAEVRRLPRGGRQPAVARHPELRPRTPAALGRVHDAERGARRGRGGAHDLRQRQPRPHVRAAAADGRRGARGRGRGDRVRAAASVVLSADARAQHAVPSPSAAAARRRRGRRHRGRRARDARRRRLRALRDVRATRAPGRECRHNLNYWRFGDYLGIGAGAHSKLSFPDRVVRQVRYKQPKQYLEQVAAGAPLMENAEVSPRRHRVRIHAERAAPDRRRAGVALRRAHRLSARDRRARARGGGSAGIDRARSRT